jgi:hypothetical protein
MRHKTNVYDLTGEYGIGYTSKGEEFWFDLEDYDKIKDYCWYLAGHGYFKARTLKSDNFKSDKIYLHRIIMDAKDGELVDHIHHNKNECNYDNRKSNLRIVGYSENGMNSVIPANNKSGCKGVFYDNTYNKWVARICINRKTIQIGSYESISDAIDARQDAEKKYFGKYSYFNTESIQMEV